MNVLDQIVTESRSESGTTRTSKTTYDAAGNPVDRCRWDGGAIVGACLPVGTTPWTNPPSHASSTEYDARNQRVELTDGTTKQTVRYDPEHNYQVSAAYVPVGTDTELQTVYTYDDRHRLTEVFVRHCMVSGHTCITPPGDVLGQVLYAYDANDYRTLVRESGSGWADALPGWFYCYDARNQLVARNTGGACSAISGDETYTYDDAGNRLSATQDGITRTFTYDADGLYEGATHDASGRVNDLSDWHMIEYDAEGRLTSLCDSACSSGSLKLYFTYDADGRRTRIAEAGGGVTTVTDLRYTADGHISAEYRSTCDASGCSAPSLTREYVTDESGAIVKLVVPSGANAGTYVASWNGHGDAMNLIEIDARGSATLANSFSYDTWGRATVTTHNGFGDLGFRFRYVGQYGVQDDAVVGLPWLLMGARHYAPEMGRFIQPDPVAADSSLFAYARNNPASYVDASGEAAVCALAGATWWIPYFGQVGLVLCGGSLVIAGGLIVIGGGLVIANHVLSARSSNPGKMNEEVRRGQAPRSVEAVHGPHTRVDKPHVHFRDGYSRNQDGSRRHGRQRGLTNAERKWVSKHGWN